LVIVLALRYILVNADSVRYDEKLGVLSEPRVLPSKASRRNGKLYAVASVAILCIVGIFHYQLSIASHNIPGDVPSTEFVDFDDARTPMINQVHF